MSGISWQDRLKHAVRVVLGALLHGENVLVHCFRGRHRSGAFAMFCLALIMGWDLETARVLSPSSRLRRPGSYHCPEGLDPRGWFAMDLGGHARAGLVPAHCEGTREYVTGAYSQGG